MNEHEFQIAKISAGALWVPADALVFSMSRSSGPGGQNVNKVNTRVELRVPITAIQGFIPPILQRFRMLAGKKLTAAGELRIVSQETRSQESNREIVTEMLRQLMDEASRLPKKRHATKPSRGSKRRRIEAKKRRGDVKAMRRSHQE